MEVTEVKVNIINKEAEKAGPGVVGIEGVGSEEGFIRVYDYRITQLWEGGRAGG